MVKSIQDYSQLIIRLILSIAFILLWIESPNFSQAAAAEDACDGLSIGASCSYERGDGKGGSNTFTGECRRGRNSGEPYCGNAGAWQNCADHDNAAGDPCVDTSTGQTGQCQRVETGSGNLRNTRSQCIPSANSGGENDAGAGPGGGGAPDDTSGGGAPDDTSGGGAPDDTSGGNTDTGSSGGNGGGSPQPQPQSVQFDNPITATSVPELIATIIRGVLGLLGAVAVAIIVYAGFTYMTAGGNATKTAEATTAITNAVIGLVIIMGAFLIVDYVISAIIG